MKLLLLCLFVLVAAGNDRHDAARILSDGRYQTDLPGEEEDPYLPRETSPERYGGTGGIGSPEPMEKQGGSLEFPHDDSSVNLPGEGLRLVGSVLLWVVIGVLVILAVTQLLRLVRGRSGGQSSAARVEVELPLSDPTEDSPGVAERLAREGRFSEAIHEMLLSVLATLLADPERRIVPSLTSREIVRTARIEPAALDPLRALVKAVERSHFGCREASFEEYEVCLKHARRFTEASGRVTS